MSKKIDSEKYPFLSSVQETQENKNLDELQEQIITVLSLHGLTTDEVAALLFSTMRNTLSQKKNKEMLKINFNIDVERLGAEGILAVQQALLEGYLSKEVKQNQQSH